MDKDAQLIYESYRNRITVNESWISEEDAEHMPKEILAARLKAEMKQGRKDIPAALLKRAGLGKEEDAEETPEGKPKPKEEDAEHPLFAPRLGYRKAPRATEAKAEPEEDEKNIQESRAHAITKKHPQYKQARAGHTIGTKKRGFEKISKSAAKEYGSKEAGKRVAGAVLAKLRARKRA